MADINRQKLVLKYRSVDGWKSTAFMTTQDNPDPALGSLANVSAAISACSNAGLMYAERQPVLLVNAAPVAGPFGSIRDRAVIEFRAADSTTGRIIIPAPITAVFKTGNERVDFSNGLVDAVVQAVLANLCSASGSPWVTAISGKRTRLKGFGA